MFEVPIYEFNRSDRRPEVYYILHIVETKTAFVPEASENVEETPKGGTWWPILFNDVLAMRASAAEGVDLWEDPTIHDRMFLSDRLKEAMKVAGIRVRQLGLKPCRVV